MNHIFLKAYGKINLTLDVLGKRADGYHELKTVMQSIQLHDTLFIKKIPEKEIKIICNYQRLHTDARNLVYQAADMLINRYALAGGIFMELNKGIPLSAGLAGGSTDCAAALLGMRAIFDLPISDGELLEMGKSLGADVPFCLSGGTALACGIGDQLTVLPDHPPTVLVLAKPRIQVSTANVFSHFEIGTVTARPDLDRMLTAIHHQNLPDITANYGNVLEQTTTTLHPVIADIKAHLLDQGAIGALMSGSGPTVFACFHHKAAAVKAMKSLKRLPALCTCEVILTYTQRADWSPRVILPS